jgi:hypothetical protein
MAVSHGSQGIIPQSAESNKAIFAATGLPRLERDLQCISDPRGLHLHMIPQHQLLGVGMQIHLLVHPLGHWVAVQGRAPLARTLAEAAPPEVAAASAVTHTGVSVLLHQPLAVILDEAQELQPTAGGRCLRSLGDS